jgi:hypothetical protein
MTVEEVVSRVARAESWSERVAAIRSVPEHFGLAQQPTIYSLIARRVFVPNLAPDFAYVHWREDYELESTLEAYDEAARRTQLFTKVDVSGLASTILEAPETLRVFRLLLGFTAQEFAAATLLAGEGDAPVAVSVAKVKAIEAGRRPTVIEADRCASVVGSAMSGTLFRRAQGEELRLKTEKPDTARGWSSVHDFAVRGVPLGVFLHQRQYGGAFRQLLDATSTKRGDVLEDEVERLFQEQDVLHIRTGSHDQARIQKRFGLTVKPAPDFVVFDEHGSLRAILECKSANDSGTARDKAGRFEVLRKECARLGGIPLFAILAGLGWTRTADALGPVVRDTDGRVFTLPTLVDMLNCEPFPRLVQTQT